MKWSLTIHKLTWSLSRNMMRQIYPTQNVNPPPHPELYTRHHNFIQNIRRPEWCLYTALLPHRTIEKLHTYRTSSRQWIINSVAILDQHSLWHRVMNICTDCVRTMVTTWQILVYILPGRPEANQALYFNHSKHFPEWSDLMVLIDAFPDCSGFVKNWLRSLLDSTVFILLLPAAWQQ